MRPARSVPWYFAYGSNMNADRMAERQLRVRRALAGRLPGLTMVFDKRGGRPGEGHANLVYAPRALAEGVLYELESESELRKLDRFERTPINYSRELVTVTMAGAAQPAWVYLANPGARTRGLLPTRDYLNHLLAGKAFLSATYLARLEAQRVLPEQSGEA